MYCIMFGKTNNLVQELSLVHRNKIVRHDEPEQSVADPDPVFVNWSRLVPVKRVYSDVIE